MDQDAALLPRVRALVSHHEENVEKRMFGGAAFMLDDVLAVGVLSGGDLLVRVDPDRQVELLARPGAGPFVMGGRGGSTGWVTVQVHALLDDDVLERWVDLGVERARVLAVLGPRRRRGRPGPGGRARPGPQV